MKKLLFINSLYFPHIGGGAEIIFQEQVEGFKRKGYHVVVLTTGNNAGMEIDFINSVKVYRAETKNFYWHFNKSNKARGYLRALWHLRDSYNRRMRQYVKDVIGIEKPDVVICHNITGFSISVWDEVKAAGLPIIQILHDLYLVCPKSTMFKNEHACDKQCKACHFLRLGHAQKSRAIDAVVGVSAYILNRLKGYGYFENVPSYVIHNAREIPEPPKHLPWVGGEPLKLGYIGTLSKAKGLEWLITQFMGLDINATLTIAGRGESAEYEKYLRDLAFRDKRISFSGYVISSEHYSSIHVSIVPSLWPDTFPTVAFESCAYHVPVIATTLGGLPEIIKSGINGWLCDVNNTNSLGEAILKVYGSPEVLHDYSIKAYESVKEMLDVDRVLSAYEEIVEKLN